MTAHGCQDYGRKEMLAAGTVDVSKDKLSVIESPNAIRHRQFVAWQLLGEPKPCGPQLFVSGPGIVGLAVRRRHRCTLLGRQGPVHLLREVSRVRCAFSAV